MKKIFAIILMSLVVCVNANAQERVNGEYYKFNHTSQKIKDVVKWEYDVMTEQWNAPLNRENDIEISIKTFTHNNKTHYVLCLETTRVGYKQILTLFGLVEEKYYYKHSDYVFVNDNIYSVMTNCNEGLHYFKTNRTFGDDAYENRVIRDILRHQNDQDFELSILFYKDVVRFNTSGDIFYEKNLKKRYYEVSKNDWLKLFNDDQETSKKDELTISELWESLDTLEVFKRPTADEIWEDFKNASIAKQDTVETTTVSDSITTPKTDEIWESYENAVRYIKYNDASYLETTYLRIESLLYANKREMRKLPKNSNELQLKKQQIKIMKAKMEEIDRKYFELTNKYIYQG